LIAAANYNSVAIVQLLLNHGADISITDTAGQTALFKAVGHGHMFMVDMLVKRGLSITALDCSGNTLLMMASSQGQKAAAEWLIQHALTVHAASNIGVASLHIDATDSRNWTALHYASASSGCDAAAIIELLLANGADVHKCTDIGQTVLGVAVCNGNVECAKVLIAAGADVNQRSSEGLTCLHMAVLGQHSAAVQLLLDHGATAGMNTVVPIPCKYSDSAYYCCTSMTALTMCTTVDTIKVLLAAGADVHITTDAGDTCLHVAVRHVLPLPVMCLLIKAGIDIHALNNEGVTAVDIAHEKQDNLVKQLLIRTAQQQLEEL
jgi:ankyrin repeat protein